MNSSDRRDVIEVNVHDIDDCGIGFDCKTYAVMEISVNFLPIPMNKCPSLIRYATLKFIELI